MGDRLRMLVGALFGATAMYYLDPARGRYRRSLVANRLVHTERVARRAVRVAGRDLLNRTIGTAAALRATLLPATTDDAVLAARVRACLGRVVSHPSSVRVEAQDGVVTLSGPVLAKEVPQLIACVERVHGVRDVRNELDEHEEPGHVPGLQGAGRARRGPRAPFGQSSWSPAERLVGAVGGALALAGSLRQRGPAALVLGAAGLLLLGRAATNLEMRRLLGVNGERRTIDVHKSIRIHAPVEEVFALWDNFENFPSFMSHVVRVRRLRADADRWRWTVQGPGGTRADFDAVVTAREENRLLAWRTEAGDVVQHEGRVKFIPHDDGTTTVEVGMAYSPVGGALGHAVARLLGADPKHQMDDDLLRMKTYLETGRAPRDAAAHAPGNGGEPPPREAPPAQTH
jgi:uncharacterized membrane protein